MPILLILCAAFAAEPADPEPPWTPPLLPAEGGTFVDAAGMTVRWSTLREAARLSEDPLVRRALERARTADTSLWTGGVLGALGVGAVTAGVALTLQGEGNTAGLPLLVGGGVGVAGGATLVALGVNARNPAREDVASRLGSPPQSP